MKLIWERKLQFGNFVNRDFALSGSDALANHDADGENASYSIIFENGWWTVLKYNANGTVVQNNRCITLTGAKARAQAWEDR